MTVTYTICISPQACVCVCVCVCVCKSGLVCLRMRRVRTVRIAGCDLSISWVRVRLSGDAVRCLLQSLSLVTICQKQATI